MWVHHAAQHIKLIGGGQQGDRRLRHPDAPREHGFDIVARVQGDEFVHDRRIDLLRLVQEIGALDECSGIDGQLAVQTPFGPQKIKMADGVLVIGGGLFPRHAPTVLQHPMPGITQAAQELHGKLKALDR